MAGTGLGSRGGGFWVLSLWASLLDEPGWQALLGASPGLPGRACFPSGVTPGEPIQDGL